MIKCVFSSLSEYIRSMPENAVSELHSFSATATHPTVGQLGVQPRVFKLTLWPNPRSAHLSDCLESRLTHRHQPHQSQPEQQGPPQWYQAATDQPDALVEGGAYSCLLSTCSLLLKLALYRLIPRCASFVRSVLGIMTLTLWFSSARMLSMHSTDLYAYLFLIMVFILYLVSEKHARSKRRVHHDLSGSLSPLSQRRDDQESQACRSHSIHVSAIVTMRYDLGHEK